MQYSETLNFLYSQLPMYQRVGAPAFKKGLGNTKALLAELGNPDKRFPVIHIAGTNGKGTVAHMLAACLTASGLKTGLYVSPHYRDFRERMKIDGKLVSKKDVVSIVERMKPAIERVHPSFFEMTVALAFEVFASQHVDIAVIETGLGGRLDSTNVVQPLLSVITNISFDHMAMLGNTLPKIAREKAGIIKKDTPVVIGEFQKEVAPVFRSVAKRRHAPLSYASRSVRAKRISGDWNQQQFEVSTGKEKWFPKLKIGCAGPFQQHNLTTALHAIRVLRDVRPDLAPGDQQIRKGLAGIRELAGYKGRWQTLGTDPLILCDSAHNEAGLRLTLRALRKEKYARMHCVLGIVNDKDPDGILSQFPANATYYFCRPDIPRGLPATELQAIAEMYGLKGDVFASVQHALRAARKTAAKEDLIFVGGSTFVVAEVV